MSKSMKKTKAAADEFWLVVAECVDVADIAEHCGVWDTEAGALNAASECASEEPHLIYHCKRSRLVSA